MSTKIDQLTRNNPETDSGYSHPQIGFFVNEIIECEIGFSSTYDDGAKPGTEPKVPKWLEAYKADVIKHYGEPTWLSIRAGIDAAYKAESDAADAFAIATGKESWEYDGDDLNGAVEKCIADAIEVASK